MTVLSVAAAGGAKELRAPSENALVEVTSTTLSISWSASWQNEGWARVAGYGLYRDGALVGTTTGTRYTFEGLECGTAYALGVDSYTEAGRRSTTVTLTASTAPCGRASGDTSPPSSPSGVNPTAASGTGISLAWTASADNVGVAGYGIYKDGANVGTTTATSFTFANLTCGSAYSLGVDAFDAAGNRSTITAVTASTAPCAVAPTSTSPPAVTGTARVGQTLSGSSGYWSGTTPMSYAYQWLRCDSSGANCSAVSGAVAQTYLLASGDAGSTFRIKVTATNSAGSASAQSAPTTVVAQQTSVPPTSSVLPAITGIAKLGQSLTGSAGSWSGTTPMTYAYQWLRCDSSGANCSAISGATTQTYLVASGDVGSTLRLKVTATNSAGSASAQSAQTALVTADTTSSIYWGAWIGSHLTGTQPPWDMNPVTKFESLTGKPLSVIHFSSPWQNRCTSPYRDYSFDTGAMNNIRNHGAIPFFTWGSQASCTSNQTDFQLARIAAGAWDSYVTSWAQAAKSWGGPLFLRLNPEQNGYWNSWSPGVNGNSVADYVTSWRHVHDIFRQVGATNVTWVWCPNIDPSNIFTNLASLYPGDAYVDWTCLDGYNFGTNPAKPGGWQTFDWLYSTTYHKIVDTIAPSKPMIIGEVASSEYGGSKAAWISDMLSALPLRYPKIKGVLWFERYDGSLDWPIETSATATQAFASGIRSSYYRSNTFGSLPLLSKVPIPS
jgi:mannan endo-1,4-beta-mannosidase